MPKDLLPYLLAVLVITLTPGADTAVVLRNALTFGAGAAVASALGSATGLLVWGAASAAGVAALLAASALAFTAVKVVGAIYLVYLGVQAWRHAGADAGLGDADADPAAARSRGTQAAYRQGLLTNLTNPKAALFFTALLPQFLSP